MNADEQLLLTCLVGIVVPLRALPDDGLRRLCCAEIGADARADVVAMLHAELDRRRLPEAKAQGAMTADEQLLLLYLLGIATRLHDLPDDGLQRLFSAEINAQARAGVDAMLRAEVARRRFLAHANALTRPVISVARPRVMH